MIVAAPAAQATKYYSSFFGATGSGASTTGGLFSTARDIAINDPSVDDGSGTDGWIYVVDQSNNRIQAFNSNKEFQFTIGRNVNQTAIDATGSLGGEFNVAQGIDIDQSTGHFFVRERNNNRRVQEFTATGEFVRAFGWGVDTGADAFETCFAWDSCQGAPAGSNPGQFGSTTQADTSGIAVPPPGAPNAGEVYVADPGNRVIQRFVVPSDPNENVLAKDPITSPDLLTTDHPRHIAADANGVVYASHNTGSGTAGSGIVVRYDTTFETLLTSVPRETDDGEVILGPSQPNGIAIDHSTGHLFVGRNPAGNTTLGVGILELDLSQKPENIDEGHIVDMHGVGLGVVANSIEVNPASGELLVSTSSSIPNTGTGHRVLVPDDDGITPHPDVALLPPTNVGSPEATLRAEINPNGPTGFPTFYRFEVSKNGVSWIPVNDDLLVGSDGDGSDPVFVSDDIAGLEANTLYRLRVVTTRNPAAGMSFSSELIFATDPASPAVETVAALRVTDSSAQIIGRIHPGGVPTTYWFEWGDDSLPNRIPMPAGSAGSAGSGSSFVETLHNLQPESVYHFRLCAANSLSSGAVCGGRRTFATRAALTSPTPDRAYEMVSAPDKPIRRGGSRGIGNTDQSRLQPALPAFDGDSVIWSTFPGPPDPDAGHAFAWSRPAEIRSRIPGRGWTGEAVYNVPPLYGQSGAVAELTGISADLRTNTWANFVLMFPFDANQSTRVMGDEGGPRGAGWYPMLDPAWFPGELPRYEQAVSAIIDDHGKRLIRIHGTNPTLNAGLRDIPPADGGGAAQDLDPPQTAGRAPLLVTPKNDWRPDDLIAECTGSGPNATLIPIRDDAGTDAGPPGGPFTVQFTTWSTGSNVIQATAGLSSFPADVQSGHYVSGGGIDPGTRVVSRDSATQITVDREQSATGSFATITIGQDTSALGDDVIATAPCAEGSPTDVRGATVGGFGGSTSPDKFTSTGPTAMSDDGRRIFFTSPDPDPGVAGGESCGDGAFDDTRCPPQLFVRSYDESGEPTVRWLSRPVDALFFDSEGESQMSPASLGSDVVFEGASRDGSVVYFRTNAPLTPDDPNGGMDPLEGASPNYWDLYRYELGPDPDADPAPPGADPAGRLTRITAGRHPDANPADPNTNCVAIATSGTNVGDCAGVLNQDGSIATPNGAGAAVRFVSDDGDRVYFLTAAGIPGADNSPPRNGATAPTSADSQVNTSTRNLYLYDATKSGLAAIKFIAVIPFATDGLNSCASFQSIRVGPARKVIEWEESPGITGAASSNCVHGSSAGDGIVFETTGQLAPTDGDSAGDVYAYDAAADELVHLSAPPPGATPYDCGEATFFCNADLGFNRVGLDGPGDETFGLVGLRHWNIAEDSDGRLSAVHFESRLPLAASAAANEAMKVYEWRRADGHTSLISPAGSVDSAFYSGSGRDGDSVFFWTEQPISAWEIDPADGDIYVARRGGGLPEPLAPPVPCDVLSGGCQAPAASTRASSSPATVTKSAPSASDPAARECTGLAKGVRQASRRVRSLRKQVRDLKRSANRKARNGNARRAQRLRLRAQRLERRMQTQRRHVQRLQDRFQECREAPATQSRGGKR